MNYIPGMKVVLKGREKFGFAEIDSYSEDNEHIVVSYYYSPVDRETLSVKEHELTYDILPHQTRCFAFKKDEIYYGRIIVCQTEDTFPRCYYVKWPNENDLEKCDEDSFKVKAYNNSLSPINVLSQFSYETPFFFDQRYNLIKNIYEQNRLCEGLIALPSSKIEFFDHQVEVARKILQDPIIRYLLSDEVGLGKTVEAGLILRQITLDWNYANILVFVPKVLVNQWEEELTVRFGLPNVAVYPHEGMIELIDSNPDFIVIDEAHRIVSTNEDIPEKNNLYQAAKKLSHKTRHILLLSATPVLHRDSDLLALLHLLDPNSFKLDGLAALKTILKMRQELGKTLLALSKARFPLLVRRHAKKMREILSADPLVESLVEKIIQSEDAEILNYSNALEAHISESYRLNRRMIRTRRSWLREEFGIGERKIIEQQREYDLDEDSMSNLWSHLENWRIEVASIENEQDYYSSLYIKIAQAIASDHVQLKSILHGLDKNVESPAQKEIINNMLYVLSNIEEDNDRISLLCMFIQGRLRRDPPTHKHVVFCTTSSIVNQIKKRLLGIIEPDLFQTITIENKNKECESALKRFQNDPSCRFLIADTIIEEGINLQFAEGFVLYDMPWDPMRIEQRFGRLDRINRVHDIPCWIILSSEEDNLAFDEAWCEVLKRGFGVFEDSLSDLQFLIDRKMPELTRKVFEGGPEALLAVINDLHEEIMEERELIAEQDVIDGLRLTEKVGSNLRENLDTIDIEAKNFSKSLKFYLERNLKFKLWWLTDDVFTYKINDEPLLPVFKLEKLIRDLQYPTTHHRELANKNSDLKLLRPGCSSLISIQEVLSWDDRGRVFAMWRRAKQILEPKIIFRVINKIELNRDKIEGLKNIYGWDKISQNGLIRLISSWLPESIVELFLDEKKHGAADEFKQLCLPTYRSSKSDTNLGGIRSIFLRNLFTGEAWPRLCNDIGKASLDLVVASDKFKLMKATALTKARRHFDLLSAQLEARANSGIEEEVSIRRELDEQKTLFSTILDMIEKPQLSIDTVGVYVFSETPFWEIEQ